MATRVTYQLIDDIDGSEAVETVTFALDGVEYAIDLSEGHADELRHALTRFAQHARRVGGRRAPKPATPKVPKPAGVKRPAVALSEQRERNLAVRKWARANGYTVPERGRISAHILAAFENRDSVNSKVIMNETVDETVVVKGGSSTPGALTVSSVKTPRRRSTSPRSRATNGGK